MAQGTGKKISFLHLQGRAPLAVVPPHSPVSVQSRRYQPSLGSWQSWKFGFEGLAIRQEHFIVHILTFKIIR